MNDDLSRLLEGELDPDAEAALRAQIAASPELARKWAAMQVLPSQLADLPNEMSPPELRLPGSLPQRPAVAARFEPPASPSELPPARRPWLHYSLLLAAGLSIGILLPRPLAELRIARGAQVVDGRINVLAGDVSVDVDGKVQISVEPPRGVPREQWAEIPTMDKTHFLSALAGAVVTLTVVEGSAIVRPAGAPPIELVAGQQRTVGGGGGNAITTAAPRQADATVVSGTSTAHELAKLKLEHAVTLGQLRALGGRPAEWPADLPAAYKPDAFEAFVAARVATIPHASLVTMDCDEYPCIAVLRSTDPAAEWQDNLSVLHDDLGETAFGHGTNVIGFGSERDDGEHAVRLYAFSIVPGDDGGVEPDVRSRLDVRVRGDMEGVSEELMDEAKGPEAVIVE